MKKITFDTNVKEWNKCLKKFDKLKKNKYFGPGFRYRNIREGKFLFEIFEDTIEELKKINFNEIPPKEILIKMVKKIEKGVDKACEKYCWISEIFPKVYLKRSFFSKYRKLQRILAEEIVKKYKGEILSEIFGDIVEESERINFNEVSKEDLIKMGEKIESGFDKTRKKYYWISKVFSNIFYLDNSFFPEYKKIQKMLAEEIAKKYRGKFFELIQKFLEELKISGCFIYHPKNYPEVCVQFPNAYYEIDPKENILEDDEELEHIKEFFNICYELKGKKDITTEDQKKFHEFCKNCYFPEKERLKKMKFLKFNSKCEINNNSQIEKNVNKLPPIHKAKFLDMVVQCAIKNIKKENEVFPLIYEITNKKGIKNYLIGTCHEIPIEIQNLHFNKLFNQCLKKCQKLIIEADLEDDFSNLNQECLEQGFLDFYIYDVFKKERKEINFLEINKTQKKIIKAFNFAQTLYECKKNYLISEKRTKKIGFMENISISVYEENFYLRRKKLFKCILFDLWKFGNEKNLEKFFDLETNFLCKMMVFIRNKFYMEKEKEGKLVSLKNLKDTKKPTLIAVGMAHLIGTHGLVKIFKKDPNLTVTKVSPVNERKMIEKSLKEEENEGEE